MKKTNTLKRTIKMTALYYVLALAVVATTIEACHKSCDRHEDNKNQTTTKGTVASPITQITVGKSETSTLNVAVMRKSGDGHSTKVMFTQRAEMFTATDATMIATLQNALTNNKSVTVTTNPWTGEVLQVVATGQTAAQRTVAATTGTAARIDLATMPDETVNNIAGMAIINTTTTATLTNVIPDMASAQLMFDYITHQCCAVPGPYTIDYCIPFQYCEDGCYARAHKMCWIINNKYNYATHKVFSFANAGADELCVKGEKWGGCCVNWWYHVAPLVNIKTAKGIQAYVFDPAMFDQPVLLATWLHAQANPACVPGGDVPNVTMINIQPTASFWPSDGTGYDFDTDPYYVTTDHYLSSYGPLTTCP